jgi:hypothetical protein
MAVHRPRPDRRARRTPGPVVLAWLLLAGTASSLAAGPPADADAPLEHLRDPSQAREIELPHDAVRPPDPAPAGSAADAWWRYRERPVAPVPRPAIERPRPRPPGGGDHPAYRPLPSP